MISFSNIKWQYRIWRCFSVPGAGTGTLFNVNTFERWSVWPLCYWWSVGNSSRFFSTGGITSSPLCSTRVERHRWKRWSCGSSYLRCWKSNQFSLRWSYELVVQYRTEGRRAAGSIQNLFISLSQCGNDWYSLLQSVMGKPSRLGEISMDIIIGLLEVSF